MKYLELDLDGNILTTTRATNKSIPWDGDEKLLHYIKLDNGMVWLNINKITNFSLEKLVENVNLIHPEDKTAYDSLVLEKQNQKYKQEARSDIRSIKDYEDDLCDLKQVVQFMARGFAGLWSSLPDEIKVNNPYKDNFDLFTQAVAATNMRVDLELDQVSKISDILQDEATFADIVKTKYLDKKVK